MKTYGLIEKRSYTIRILKWMLAFLGYDVFCFVIYAMFIGQTLNDIDELSAKKRVVCIFSAILLVIFAAVLFSIPRRDLSIKTQLVQNIEKDGFEPENYYKATFIAYSLPVFAAGFTTLLPYAIFYQIAGFGYERSLPFENFFTGHLALMIPLGGIVALVLENVLLCGVFALSYYQTQKQLLAERINRPWEKSNKAK